MPVSGIYSPKALSPSGMLQSDPMNIAGQTPQTALRQASQQTGLGAPQNPLLRQKGGPANQLSKMSVGPNGEVEYQMQTDPFSQRLGQLSAAGVLSKGGAAGPQVQHGGIDEGREASARDAAFARAKDRAGLIAQSGVKSLKNIMASRGLQGSTMEGDAVMNQVQEGVGQLGGVVREQAINEAGRAGDIADMEYQGGIQQRGQDINANQSVLALLNRIGAY